MSSTPFERGVERFAVAAVGERDELDHAAGERPADVAAKLEARRVGGEVQAVVAFGPVGREDQVGLDEILGEALEAGVEVDRLVGRGFERDNWPAMNGLRGR